MAKFIFGNEKFNLNRKKKSILIAKYKKDFVIVTVITFGTFAFNLVPLNEGRVADLHGWGGNPQGWGVILMVGG